MVHAVVTGDRLTRVRALEHALLQALQRGVCRRRRDHGSPDIRVHWGGLRHLARLVQHQSLRLRGQEQYATAMRNSTGVSYFEAIGYSGYNRVHLPWDATMLRIVVIPCLNEEASLNKTCESLGFCHGPHGLGDDTLLVLVDNGSTDRTVSVMERVLDRSLAGQVHILHESERGYVPPRHRGVLFAREAARARRAAEERVLIVQADADTAYGPLYVDTLAEAAGGLGLGVLLEGLRETPPEFAGAHPGFVALCGRADADIAAAFVAPEIDVIVDDKACAFALADYFAWGGLNREYTSAGEEVYAETSRLYMRGRLRGARRMAVPEAIAYPSRRKLYGDPVGYFATAGFPREASWYRHFGQAYQGPRGLDAFEHRAAAEVLAEAIRMRQAHCVALFALLPAHVESLRKLSGNGVTTDESSCNGARLFEWAFARIAQPA